MPFLTPSIAVPMLPVVSITKATSRAPQKAVWAFAGEAPRPNIQAVMPRAKTAVSNNVILNLLNFCLMSFHFIRTSLNRLFVVLFATCSRWKSDAFEQVEFVGDNDPIRRGRQNRWLDERGRIKG